MAIRKCWLPSKLPVWQLGAQRCFSAGKVTESNMERTAMSDSKSSNVKSFGEMPGPKAWPILGTGWQMLPLIGNNYNLQRMHITQRNQYKQYGIIWKEVFPGLGPLVFTANPDDAEVVFRNDGKYPTRPIFSSMTVYRSSRPELFDSAGILNENGEAWYKIRSKAQQPMLKAQSIVTYLPALGEIADEFVLRIRDLRDAKDETPADFLNEIYKWALESVALVALNTRLGCLDPKLEPGSESQRMIEAVGTILEAFVELEFKFPFWRFFSTPTWRRFVQAQDYSTQTAVKYINKTMEQIKNRPANAVAEPSMLESLLMQDNMSHRDAVIMVIDMLMAGTDTTSHTLAFLLYHLAKNPDKQEKLRREILSVVPVGAPVTDSTLTQLPYLRACLKESMRLKPIGTGNGRIINKDLVLSGYQVPSGTMVLILNQLMCGMEEHFPQPESYIPERWIKGHALENNAPPYVLLPFGIGPRMCIGRRLAEQEVFLLTVKMLQKFRIDYHYGEIDCITRILSAPDKPLKFTLKEI